MSEMDASNVVGIDEQATHDAVRALFQSRLPRHKILAAARALLDVPDSSTTYAAPTVREAAREYLRELDARVARGDADAVTPAHAANVRGYIEALTDAVGDVQIANLTEAQCRQVLFTRPSRRGGKLAPVTQGKYLDAWQALFRWCEAPRRGYVTRDTNPVRGIEVSTNAPPKTEPITAAAWEAFLGALPLDGRRDSRPLYLQFVYETGADPGETETERVTPRHLVWDGDDGGAWVNVPGSKERCRDRWVPLRPWYATQIRAWCEGRPATRPVFDHWYAGNRSLYVREACARAGLTAFASKDLRAAFNDRLREAGVAVTHRDELLGHAVAGINGRYSRQKPASQGGPKPLHLRAAVESLPVYALPAGWPVEPPTFREPGGDSSSEVARKGESPGISEAFLERDTGFEPATFSLGSPHSRARCAEVNTLARHILSTVRDPEQAWRMLSDLYAPPRVIAVPQAVAAGAVVRPLAARRETHAHSSAKLKPDGDSDDEPPIARVVRPTPRGLGRAG